MFEFALPGESESIKVNSPESLSSCALGMEETSTVEVLTRAELDLTCCSEKLVNLHNLLMHVFAWRNEMKSAVEYDNISPDFVEKAMEFDLLDASLNAEVRELDNFAGSLQAMVVDIRQKMACGQLKDMSTIVHSKWDDTVESLRQLQDHILEMKIQLAKLQMTSLAFNQNEWNSNISVDLLENFQVSRTYLKPQLQLMEERHILRMLEKSLARELDLEKQLTEIKQNEEDIKLKLRLTEQVAQHIEEAAEVIWGRFLEAENTAEVLLGMSKEMVGQLQIARFNLDNSIQREKSLDSKLQYYVAQSNAKENSMKEFNSISAQLLAKNDEVSSLNKRVNLLEEKLRESLSQLKVVKATYEESQEQLAEMDGMVESMRETIDDTEGRAESAETKVTELADANTELTEELNFLKGNNDSNNKKISLLEKQLRDQELKLQHARASSEASQEQQNMLYTAIWDMETLIDELKQKVSKAENKTENAEEQCVVLSEANLELNKEVEFLRSRIEYLEITMDQATVEKMASAKDINIKTSVIMNMVMQLAFERERVEQQLHALAKENKFLKGKLMARKKDECSISQDDTHQRNPTFRAESTDKSLNEASQEKASEASSNSHVEETLNTASSDQNEMGSLTATDHGSNLSPEVENKNLVEEQHSSRMYIFMAVLIVLLSGLVTYLLNTNHSSSTS